MAIKSSGAAMIQSAASSVPTKIATNVLVSIQAFFSTIWREATMRGINEYFNGPIRAD